MVLIDVILIFIGLVFLYLIAELFNFEFELNKLINELISGNKVMYKDEYVTVIHFIGKYVTIMRKDDPIHETIHIYELVEVDSLFKKLWKKLRKI